MNSIARLFGQRKLPTIEWETHLPPKIMIDPNTGLEFPARATWRDSHGNVWAARDDIDARGRGRNDPDYDSSNPHCLVVEIGGEDEGS